MYRPPERIKHDLPMAPAPSASEVATSKLFAPVTLASGLELESRTWVPAMVPWRATHDGCVTDEVLTWYGRFAEGQPGAIVVEATGIRDVPSGPLLRIGHDRYVAGLRELVETVRARSAGHTRVLIQIIDFLRVRRRPERTRFFAEFFLCTAAHREALARLLKEAALTTCPEERVRETLASLPDGQLAEVLNERELEALSRGARERVWDVSAPHIRDLPTTLPPLFSAAAERAQRAGFDGVELHYAHAYTMAGFLSAQNRRADGYGQTRPGRVRLPLEVFKAVRARVGREMTVGCRMLCDEIIDGGSRVEDAAFFATQLAGAGMDYISLSTGGKFEDAAQPKIGRAVYPYTGKSGWECMPTVTADQVGPFGRNVPKQARIRAAIRAAGRRTPVVICGGINHFAQAEAYLQQGAGDIIASARQSLADPDWFRKVRLGHGDEVRRCIYTNYCEALDQRHEMVTCQLWDRLEPGAPGVSTSADGKRRLIAPSWKPPTSQT